MTRKQKERLGDMAFLATPFIGMLLIVLTEVWL